MAFLGNLTSLRFNPELVFHEGDKKLNHLIKNYFS